MLVLLTLLTAGYFATVVWIVRGKRRAGLDGRAAAEATAGSDLPVDDRPPSSAVGWPPGGRQFTSYVDEGFRALDAYLSEGYAA
jgi:hypothetical protein